jgi:HSP20 family protein
MYTNAFTHAATWNPWQEMQRIQAEMNRLFGGLERQIEPEFPPIEAWAGENGLCIVAALPGVDMKDIELSVVGDTLTLKGTRPEEILKEGEAFHRRERGTGRFTRTLQLPFNIEVDAVKATSRNGMLEVDLPRAVSERPRKIAVQAAH